MDQRDHSRLHPHAILRTDKRPLAKKSQSMHLRLILLTKWKKSPFPSCSACNYQGLHIIRENPEKMAGTIRLNEHPMLIQSRTNPSETRPRPTRQPDIFS